MMARHSLQHVWVAMPHPKHHQQIAPKMNAEFVADMDKVILQDVLICNAAVAHVHLHGMRNVESCKVNFRN